MDKVCLKYNPQIHPDQLWNFYIRNDICEVGFGKEVAVLPLKYSPYIVGAFQGDTLVGIIRALFDGVSAVIMEFCLECSLQGDNLKYSNGSLLEKDEHGIAKEMGSMLIEELRKIGNTSVTTYLVENLEEKIYESIGFKVNKGHLVYVIDERPYLKENEHD